MKYILNIVTQDRFLYFRLEYVVDRPTWWKGPLSTYQLYGILHDLSDFYH